MATIARRDPRRRSRLSAEGVRRIVLGASAASATTDERPGIAAHAPLARPVKPVRRLGPAQRHLLVLVHSEHGALDAHAQQTIAGAALIADAATAVVVAVLGELREELASFGADVVLSLPECDWQSFQPEQTLAHIAALRARYQPLHILLPDRALGEADLGRRLAATQQLSVATQVVELRREGLASYHHAPRQRMRAPAAASRTLARHALTEVILLAPQSVESELPFVGRAERASLAPPQAALARCHDDGLHRLEAAQLSLEEADFIAAAGNGVTDVALFERLAATLGATTAASRVAVDDGRFARDKQIGATGKTVVANCYLALGISGAVQHLQGIKDCRHVVAVNRDAAAPIVARANLALIADSGSFMQALLEALTPP